jgi:hypothetical protein
VASSQDPLHKVVRLAAGGIQPDNLRRLTIYAVQPNSVYEQGGRLVTWKKFEGGWVFGAMRSDQREIVKMQAARACDDGFLSMRNRENASGVWDRWSIAVRSAQNVH